MLSASNPIYFCLFSVVDFGKMEDIKPNSQIPPSYGELHLAFLSHRPNVDSNIYQNFRTFKFIFKFLLFIFITFKSGGSCLSIIN